MQHVCVLQLLLCFCYYVVKPDYRTDSISIC
jgi:hypothetical protein